MTAGSVWIARAMSSLSDVYTDGTSWLGKVDLGLVRPCAKILRLLMVALLLAACGGAATSPSPVPSTPAAVTPEPSTESPDATADFAAACGDAADAISAMGQEVTPMLMAALDADADTLLNQKGRVNLMAEQAIDDLPANYRDHGTLKLYAERMALIQTLTAGEWNTIPFTEAMNDLLEVYDALDACR